MEESDAMLLNSLRDFISVPAQVTTLADIKTDEIFFIALKVLENVGSNISDIKAIQKQKFRATTKLSQKIHSQLDIEVELNDLLNPSIPFIRKTLLLFMTKIGSGEQNDRKSVSSEFQENAQKRKKKKIMSGWLNQEWIHPALMAEQQEYQANKFSISVNRRTFKANILPFVLNSPAKNNSLDIFTTALHKNQMKTAQAKSKTGIAKKKHQDTYAQTAKLITSNFSDWNITEQKLSKIRKKMEKDKKGQEQKTHQQEQQVINQRIQEAASVFQQQLEEKIEERQKVSGNKQSIIQPQQPTKIQSEAETVISEDPIERLRNEAEQKKRQYESTIHNILLEIQQKKSSLDEFEELKEKLQTQIAIDEEKLGQYKQKTQQLKKQVEKKQLILNAVESDKPIQQEIKKYQEDIKKIQQQIKEEVTNTEEDLSNMQVQSERRLEALQNLKVKLKKIETQYKEVCKQLNYKSGLKDKVKINKSGISRTFYSKRISEIDKRWRQTQKEVTKIRRELEQSKKKTDIITDTSDKLEKEILSFMQAEKNRGDPQSKALKQMFLRCQECFKQTYDSIRKINEAKEETRQYQLKVYSLNSQNYQTGIEKINTALAELKKEIEDTKRKK